MGFDPTLSVEDDNGSWGLHYPPNAAAFLTFFSSLFKLLIFLPLNIIFGFFFLIFILLRKEKLSIVLGHCEVGPVGGFYFYFYSMLCGVSEVHMLVSLLTIEVLCLLKEYLIMYCTSR